MSQQQMPSDGLTLLQKINEYGILNYLLIVALGVWAGTVKYLMKVRGGLTPSFFGWLTETSISGFVGLLVFLLTQYYNLDIELAVFVSCAAAHDGTRTLYFLTKTLRNKTNEKVK